jgi:hypothetical protein
MQPHDFADWPEGTIVLTVLTVAAPVISISAKVVTALGATDLAVTLIGISPNAPYWYEQLFGSIKYYPTVCWASVLSRNCSSGGR